MTPMELFQTGQLDAAIQALTTSIRADPTNHRNRSFLFELLCFAGEFSRAGKHLDTLAQMSAATVEGVSFYRSALASELKRRQFYESHTSPQDSREAAPPPSGTVNGKPFHSLEDGDPRVAKCLEVFVSGEYVRLPYERIDSIRIGEPRLLRDLIWAQALIQVHPGAECLQSGEVLLPVLCPLSWEHPSEMVRLGRLTAWQEEEKFGSVPAGQKVLLVNGEEELPFLEIREVKFELTSI